MTTHLSGRIVVAGLMALVAAVSGCARSSSDQRPPTSLAGMPGGPSTSRASLDDTVSRMRARLTKDAGDATAAVTLADALIRQTRVSSNAGLANEAEGYLLAILQRYPDHYDARRMLAAVYLSEHRFREALTEAGRCLTIRTDDAWVYGVVGDAHVELGEYAAAFEAFDRMAARRPNAASYARASYARELQGDLDGAVRFMRMATEATSAQDPESLAWHHAQLGHLYLETGEIASARREYTHADYVFPGHPFATEGLARAEAADGRYDNALTMVNRVIAVAPTPAALAFAGDLLSILGRADEAERHYRLAEAAWQSDAPEPARLARFLSERGRRLDDAVRLARDVVADRRDIFTQDALAWAYFQSGDINRARAAMTIAMSTGSRDRVIRYHAAEIARASGQMELARRYVDEALDRSPLFDLMAAPAAAKLRDALAAPRVARR
ncbi:MAG: tetratricopeptide repeat protein [Acidobacteriota bacterium]